MNFYVRLITNVINFVEANIHEALTLDDIAREFNFSSFHFNRIFSTVTGNTLKQYILGRKMALAMEALEANSTPVIDVAYDFGFNSPEVFSRAFKKQYGISPSDFRQARPALDPLRRAVVVERDIVSYQGQLSLKGSEMYLNGLKLSGVQLGVNVNQIDFKDVLQSASDAFLAKARQNGQFITDHFYTIVNCTGDEDNGDYCVFWGMKANSNPPGTHFLNRQVPGGWYEKFVYCGDMFDIRLSFINDLYRWVMIKEIELEANGIGMLNIYKSDYPETHEVEILVPVKPKNKD